MSRNEDDALAAAVMALQPYRIAFSAADGAVRRAGGVAVITDALVRGVAAALNALGYPASADFFAEDGNGLVSAELLGAKAFLMFHPVDRVADREHWQVRIMTHPDYSQLQPQQREALAALHAAAAYHIADAGLIEALDVAIPEGAALPPRASPAASSLRH
ncbi:MAG: hypothetical protein GC204_03690 [Chloroflexi bacterium]|nr:hypothetical protein [Chloroflexota bacterium]